MKKLTKFDVILNLWISLIINVALSIVLPALNGFLTLKSFIVGFAIAYPVSTIFVFIVPVIVWGAKFALALGIKPDTPGFTVVSTVILALVMGTFMTLLMTAVNAGVGPHFFAAWWSCYPIALAIVYLSALAGIFSGLPLVKALVKAPKL